MTSQDRKALDQPEPGRGTLPALSEADMEVGLVRRLLTVVSAWPDRLAVIDQTQSLTYADLAGRVGAVAEALRDVGPLDQPVVMLSQHNAPAIATIIGALLSGHPLLVMDPLTPAPRLRGFAERLGASVCLTDAANEALATEVISGVGGRALRSPAEAPGPDWTTSPIWQTRLDPFRPAVLGFTSGSTGRPKVVEMNERYLVGDAWAGSTATGIAGAGDVMAHTLPLAFAAGMNVSLTGPLAGATLAMYDTRTLGIAGLADWIETAGVTMMAASPAILRAFVNGGPDPRKLRGLRRLSLSGEAAYGRDVDLARTVVPSTCWVHHRLGSTETGLISEFMADASTPIPDGRLSVGAPTGITRAELVDEEGRLVPVGQPGRLIITRSYLSTGYWGDPERTAEAFWDNGDGTCSFRTNDLGRFDESGQLFLLGRSDHSVKVRGYLVEPGEVDAVLFTLPDVAEAVTVGLPRADGLTYRLVAYVVSRAEKPNAAAIRASLREALPSHMVPETVVFLTALPRTERGKLDRSVLPAPPPIPSAEGEDAFTDWEEAIAEVWGRALAMDLDDVSRHADFFELGGDSLAAEQVISMVINDLQVPPEGVTASILIEAPTLTQFAAYLHRIPGRPVNQTITVLRETGNRPPLFIVAGGGGLGVGFIPLTRHLDADQPVYALHAHALESRGVPDWSVEATAHRYLVALRTIQPSGPYYIAGHSFGGIVAFEMAQRLHRAGHDVGLLAILDSFPPDPKLMPAPPQLSPIDRLKDVVSLARTGLSPTPGTGQYWRFYRQSDFMGRRYRSSGPYPGRTLVLVANSAERNERAQWAPHLDGDWEMTFTEGDHYSILREPHVVEVAEYLGQALTQAQAQHRELTRRLTRPGLD